MATRLASEPLTGWWGEFQDIAWHPSGFTLAAADGARIQIWDTEYGEEMGYLNGHVHEVTSLDWSPDGDVLATGSTDGTFKIWQIDRREEKAILGAVDNEGTSIAWSSDGKWVAGGGNTGNIKVWDSDGAQIGVLDELEEPVNELTWSSDGQTLATPNGNSLLFWNPETGEVSSKGPFANLVKDVAWSPEGGMLAVVFDYGFVELWELDGDGPVAVLNGSTERISEIAWSPDGATLAVAAFDSVFLWDAETQQLLADLTTLTSPYSEGIWCLAWSPDGRSLVTGDQEASIRVWDVPTQRVQLQSPRAGSFGHDPHSRLEPRRLQDRRYLV